MGSIRKPGYEGRTVREFEWFSSANVFPEHIFDMKCWMNAYNKQMKITKAWVLYAYEIALEKRMIDIVIGKHKYGEFNFEFIPNRKHFTYLRNIIDKLYKMSPHITSLSIKSITADDDGLYGFIDRLFTEPNRIKAALPSDWVYEVDRNADGLITVYVRTFLTKAMVTNGDTPTC